MAREVSRDPRWTLPATTGGEVAPFDPARYPRAEEPSVTLSRVDVAVAVGHKNAAMRQKDLLALLEREAPPLVLRELSDLPEASNDDVTLDPLQQAALKSFMQRMVPFLHLLDPQLRFDIFTEFRDAFPGRLDDFVDDTDLLPDSQQAVTSRQREETVQDGGIVPEHEALLLEEEYRGEGPSWGGLIVMIDALEALGVSLRVKGRRPLKDRERHHEVLREALRDHATIEVVHTGSDETRARWMALRSLLSIASKPTSTSATSDSEVKELRARVTDLQAGIAELETAVEKKNAQIDALQQQIRWHGSMRGLK